MDSFAGETQTSFSSGRQLNGNFLHRKASCACGGGCPRCDALPAEVAGAVRSSGEALEPALARSKGQPDAGTPSPAAPRLQSALLPSSFAPVDVQSELTVSQPEDPLEKEADRIADRVVCVPEPTLRRHTDDTPYSAARHATRLGLGRPLESGVRAFFEPRMGADLSAVRIHTGALADRSARGLGARDGSGAILGRSPDTAAGTPSSPPKGPSGLPGSTAAPGTKTGGEPERGAGELTWKWKDLLAYPLLVDVWYDVIRKQLTTKERNELKLKGTEATAFYIWAAAMGLGWAGLGGAKFEGDFGKDVSTWKTYTEALEAISPSKDAIMDGISRLAGLRIDDYLSSDLFKLRLKTHVASVVSLFLLAQGIYSAAQATKEPSAAPGEFEQAQWSKQLGLAVWLIGKVFKEHLKAPDFFDVGPLQLKTHPAFSAAPFAGAAPPSGLTLEGSQGYPETEGGAQTKFSLTLNLPKLLTLGKEGGPKAEDIGKLPVYRGWQTSAWFSLDKADPTETMKAAGKFPNLNLKGGTIFGGGGHLGLLEAGARYGGDDAKALTSWFLKGGYGYSWPKASVVPRVGFTAIYTDWKEADVLAPGGKAGKAGQVTPFFGLEIGTRHKLGVGGALSFVTGTQESFDVSGFRADLSYTYMGDKSEDGLPVFKLDLSGSLNRLDWWDPKSPLMWGVQSKASYKGWFAGGQVMSGAGAIPEERAKLLGEPSKVRVPTSVLFIAGYDF